MAFFTLYLQQINLFMKKYFLLLALFALSMAYSQDSYIGAFSQGAGLSDSRLMDAVADFTSKVRNKVVLAANIKGSPYFEEEFQKGRLDYFGRDVKGDAYFRYNAYNDEIEIGEYAEQKDAEEIIIQSAKVICYINEDKFVYLPFKDKNLSGNILGYLIELYKGEHYTLYLRKVKEFKEATVARTSYERSFPPRFVPKETFYLSVDGATAVPIEPKVSKIAKFLRDEDRKKVSAIKKDFKKIKTSFDLINLVKSIENRP